MGSGTAVNSIQKLHIGPEPVEKANWFERHVDS